MISVVVCGPQASFPVLGLVDTGADKTILPMQVAREVGIELHPCVGPSPTAFGGAALSMMYGDVDFELADDSDSYQWTARVLFHDAGPNEEELAILGHDGFLDHFLATFDAREGALELIPDEWILG